VFKFVTRDGQEYLHDIEHPDDLYTLIFYVSTEHAIGDKRAGVACTDLNLRDIILTCFDIFVTGFATIHPTPPCQGARKFASKAILPSTSAHSQSTESP